MSNSQNGDGKDWRKPSAIVLNAIMHDNKILLLKREGEKFQGHWGFRGGKIEFGENIKDAALREALEETGLDCEFVALRGISSEIIKPQDPDSPKEDEHFLLFVCQLKPKHLQLARSIEGQVEWFDLVKLPEKIIPSDAIMVKEFLVENQRSLPAHSIFLRQTGQNYFVEAFHG